MHVYGNILIRRWNKMGQVAVPITGLTPVTFLYPFQTRSWILNVIYRVFFSVQWFEVRGDYSFCWNCWNYLPSLCKRTFLNKGKTIQMRFDTCIKKIRTSRWQSIPRVWHYVTLPWRHRAINGSQKPSGRVLLFVQIILSLQTTLLSLLTCCKH